MEQTKENKMGVMPVNKLLVTMSLPIVISMLIQAMYNLVDSVFVAQINPDALTAVGMAFPMQSLMIAFQTGLGVGMNALVSRYLGQKKPYEAGLAATHALILTALNYVLFLIVGLTAIPAFFSIQTHSEIIAGYGVEYLSIVCCGSLGLFFQIYSERILQATGKTLLSMVSQILGAVINIVLDPVFIFGVDFLGIPADNSGGGRIFTAPLPQQRIKACIQKIQTESWYDKDDICRRNTFYYNECAGFGADVRYEYNTESV